MRTVLLRMTPGVLFLSVLATGVRADDTAERGPGPAPPSAMETVLPSPAVAPVLHPVRQEAVGPAEPRDTRDDLAYDPTSVYDQKGLAVPRGFVSETPSEAVDPFSGNLLLSHTDLLLPGVAGLDLRVHRFYNSKIHRNYAARVTNDPPRVALGMMLVPPSPVGLGWNLHFGRLVGAVSAARNDLLPGPRYYERSDGSQHPFFQYTGPGCGDGVSDICLISKERDNLYAVPGADPNEPDVWVLSTTNGLNVFFEHSAFDGTTIVHYATEIRDVHGNSIRIFYHDNTITIGGTPYVREYLRHFVDLVIDTAGRTINFNYDLVAGGEIRLASISVNGLTYGYEYDTATPHGRAFLVAALPPDGGAWQYAYDGLLTGDCADNARKWCECTQVTYPQGGTISYTYDDLEFWAQTNPMSVRAVTQRSTGGRAVTPGTWTYAYQRASDYAGDEHTVITRPDSSQEIYTYFGVGNGPYNPLGLAWKAGALLQRRILDAGGALLETVTHDWQPSVPISGEIWGDPWIGFDIGIVVPELVRSTTQRGSLSWVVEHTSSHASNNRPRCTTESGDGSTRYRLRAYHQAYQWQGNVLYRWTNLPVADVLSYSPYPPAVCDPAQGGDFTVNPADEFAQREYNNRGQLVRANENSRITDYGYHASGDLATRTRYRGTDAGGVPVDGVCERYDDYTSGVPRTVVRGATPPACDIGLSGEIRTADAFGRIDSVTDARGYTTRYDYDGLGRLAQLTPPPESGELPVVITRDGGVPLPTTYERITQGPYWLERRVDGFGRDLAHADVSGALVTRVFDAFGRKSFESDPAYAPGGAGDTYVYDALGRLLSVTHADASTRSYTHGTSVHTLTVTDEEERVTTLTRRAWGHPDAARLVRVQLPGEPPPTVDTYTYHVGGHLTQINYGGRQRILNYDTAKNIAQEFSVETNNLFWGYDAAGNLRCHDRGSAPDHCSSANLDDPAAPVRYAVDDLGRTTAIDYADPLTPDVTFLYDAEGNIELMIDGAGQHVFTYTATNRLASRTSTIDGVPHVTSYTYDGRGNLIAIAYPSGRVVLYDYDAANRVTAVYDDDTTYIHNATYLADRTPQSYVYGNGVTTTVTQDDRQRPDTLAATGVFGLDYDYDRVGNVTALLDPVTSYTAAFTYDALDRLDTATGPWGTLSYLYNSGGDRMRETLSGVATFYSYDSFGQLQAMTGRLALDFNYDDFGNTIRRGFFGTERHEYFYDTENRITEVLYYDPFGGVDSVVRYAYDGQGRRVRASRGGPSDTRIWHYDAGGRRIAESDGLGNPITDYIFFNGRVIAAVDVRQIPGDTDCDRDVDYDDLLFAVRCFGGPDQPPPDPELCLAADFDNDGDVDCDDDRLVRGRVPGCSAFGDFDCDGFVEVEEAMLMLTLLAGPSVPAPCVNFDADLDGDIDLADGQRMQAEFGALPIPNKLWIADADGDWSDPNNWSGGTLPGPDDVVGIDRRSGNYTVTVRTGVQACTAILCRERLEVLGGTLRVSDVIRVDNDFLLGNAIIADATILEGAGGQSLIPPLRADTGGRLIDVTLEGDHTIPNGRALRIEGQLLVNGTLTLAYENSASQLHLLDGALLGGTGQVIFGDTCTSSNACQLECEACVLDSSLTVVARGGRVNNTAGPTPWVNRATWQVNLPRGVGAMVLRGPFEHAGRIVAANNGWVQVTDVLIQPGGVLQTGIGSRAVLDGNFDNDGVIVVDDGLLEIGSFASSGPWTIGQLGTIRRNGGTVAILGRFDNAGQTITLDASTGSWQFVGSTAGVDFGAVNGLDGAQIIARDGSRPEFYRTELNIDMRASNALIEFTDITGFHGTLHATPGPGGGSGTRLFLDSRWTHVDTVEFPGTGTVVFDDATLAAQNAVQYDSNAYAKLNIHSGITFRTGSGSGSLNFARTVYSRGLIRAETPGTTLELTAYEWVNYGTIEAVNGAQLLTQALSSPRRFTNEGTVHIGKGARFEDSSIAFPSRAMAYHQAAGGLLILEIGGSHPADRGQMVLGSPTLGGTLELALVDGYVPPLGTMIPVIAWQSAATKFAQILGLDLGNGTHFDAQYTASGLVLEVVAD